MAKKQLLKFDAATGEFEDVKRGRLRKKIRQDLIAELAGALSMPEQEVRLRRTISKLNQAREAGDLAKIAELEAKAVRQLDELQKLVTPRANASATTPTGAASGAFTKVSLGPAVLNQLPPAEVTTDISGLREELRKSAANPHQGDGWRP